MKFLILLFVPMVAQSATIGCLGMGFLYNSVNIELDQDFVEVRLDSYFGWGDDQLLAQNVKEIDNNKVKLAIRFDRASCKVYKPKGLIHCSDEERRVVTIESSTGDSFRKKIPVYNASFDFKLNSTLELNKESVLTKKHRVASLRLGREHRSEYLQVSFSPSQCK